MVQRPGERKDTFQTDKLIGWLEARHAAVGRGNANRAACVGAHRGKAEAGRNRRRRAAAGATRRARGVIGIPGGAKVGVHNAVGKLEHIGLAHQYSPRGAQILHNAGVLLWHVVSKDARAAGRAHACGIHQVFQGNGDAVERAAVLTGAQCRLRLARRRQRRIRGYGDECVERWVQRLNARERALGHLDGRKRARAVTARDFANGSKEQFIVTHGFHRAMPPLRQQTSIQSRKGREAPQRKKGAVHCVPCDFALSSRSFHCCGRLIP